MRKSSSMVVCLAILAVFGLSAKPFALSQVSHNNDALEIEAQNNGATQFDGAEFYMKKGNEKKAKAVGGTLVFDPGAKAVKFNAKDSTALDVPYNTITNLLYERTAKPRYALGILVAWPLLFTKSKKHYLTIQYKGTDGQGQYALVRLDKKNYQDALATAEAQTGVKIDRNEEK